MSNTTITTVNAERFRDTVFFNLTPHRTSFARKVSDPLKYVQFLEQASEEVRILAAAEGKSFEEALGSRAKFMDPELAGALTRALKNTTSKDGKKVRFPSINKPGLQSPALDRLNEFLNDCKARLIGPFGIAQQSGFMEGVYIIAKSLVEQAEDLLGQFEHRLYNDWTNDKGETEPGYLAAFLADYPAAIERARTLPILEGGLGPLFEASDYADVERVRAQFWLEWNYLSLGIPDDLPPRLKAQAAAKYERKLADAFETVRDGLYTSLGKFVDTLVSNLTVAPGEKQKRWHASTVENIRNFCQVFDAKNIVNDDQLAAMVNEAKALIADVSADDLKQFASARENTLAGFQKIQTAIQAAITTRKGRKFEGLEDTAPEPVTA